MKNWSVSLLSACILLVAPLNDCRADVVPQKLWDLWNDFNEWWNSGNPPDNKEDLSDNNGNASDDNVVPSNNSLDDNVVPSGNNELPSSNVPPPPEAINKNVEQYTSFIIASQRSVQRFSRRLFTSVRHLSLDEECEDLLNNKAKAWMDVGGNYSCQKKEQHFKGYHSNDLYVTVGLQRSLNDWMKGCSWLKFIPSRCLTGWTVGAAATYEYEHFDFAHRSKANMQNGQGAVYALCTGPWYYAFTNLIVGYNTGTFERSIGSGSSHFNAHSKPKIFQVSGSYEFGLNNYSYCDIYIQPFVGIESGYYHFSKIEEKGVSNFKIRAEGKTLTNTRVGVHLTRDQDFDGTWTFALDLAWNHLFNFHNHLKKEFVLDGSDPKIKGFEPGWNGIEWAFTAFKEFSNQLEAYAEFSGEVWENYYNIDLRAGASWSW